jgi:hypothetical protein
VQFAALRELELKLMLEGCLTLLGGSKGEEAHIDITPFALEWLDPARQFGLVAKGECSEESPQVAGVQDDLRAVIRLAATAACARCGVSPLDVTIDLRGINFETVGLEVQARPSEEAGDAPLRRSSIDANLILAALRVACKRAGAQLGEVVFSDGATNIRMTLRGVAERMSTGMKAGVKE